MENKTLEWYLEHLPDTIKYKWLGRFEPGRRALSDFDAKIHWSERKYTYELKIYKVSGKWVVQYEMPGYDGDIACFMPGYKIKADEMIKNDSEWDITVEDFTSDTIFSGVKKLWDWLEKEGLV